MCIQTAYKLDAHYDILVVDEAHRSVSPKFKDLYTSIKYEQVLGLTGTVPEDVEYRELLEAIAPIVFTKTVDEALEIDAISNYIIYNLAVPMSKKNRARYRKFDSMLKRAQLEIGMLKRYDEELRTISIFDIAKK